jgi:hypothetical protein
LAIDPQFGKFMNYALAGVYVEAMMSTPERFATPQGRLQLFLGSLLAILEQDVKLAEPFLRTSANS